MAKLGALELPPYGEIIGPGLGFWRNPNNKFAVVCIHYTAAEEKRSEAWLRSAQAGFDASSFQQEYELAFDSYAGRPVYSGFNREAHIAKEPLTWSPRHMLWVGYDIGTHAAVFAQLRDQRLYIFATVQSRGAFGPDTRYADEEVEASALGEFILLTKDLGEEWFPGAVWKTVVDSCAFSNTITHNPKEKPIEIFRACGLNPLPGMTQDLHTRVSLVADWLQWSPKGLPGLVVDKSARLLIDGFLGGYSFERDGTGRKPDQKSPYSHTHSALQYLISRLPVRPGFPQSRQRQEEALESIDGIRYEAPRARWKELPVEDWTSY